MTILVIDGQGGNLGKQIVKTLLNRFADIDLLAVGTNSIATENMLKAGAERAATGENAVVVCADKADIIIGPLGIVIADAVLGEVTEKMACAVSRSRAKRILIPVSKCETLVAGVQSVSTAELIEDAVKKAEKLLQ